MPPDFTERRTHADALITAALQAADPAAAVASHWPAVDGPVWLVAAGKASVHMAEQAAALCGDHLKGGAVAALPPQAESATLPGSVRVYPAAHPLPDARNVTAAKAIAEVARSAGADDTLIVLISGGGSAHLAYPAGDLTVEHIRDISRAVMRAGADINALNAVRKHLEVLKGGGLARLAHPAAVITLLLSDVVGDPLDVIASGPTVPDPTTYADALAVLDEYGLRTEVPAVTAHLEAGARGEHPETLKPGDPIAAAVRSTIIGSNDHAVDAVITAAEGVGFRVAGVERGITGEAREVARRVTARHPDLAAGECLILGGETTVTVAGDGRGGRNQEMALAAAMALAGVPDVAFLSVATDGIDGPTDAAGALVDGRTAAQARAQGLDPAAHLANNDSHPLLDAVGALIRTGATGTNVNDVTALLRY